MTTIKTDRCWFWLTECWPIWPWGRSSVGSCHPACVEGTRPPRSFPELWPFWTCWHPRSCRCHCGRRSQPGCPGWGDRHTIKSLQWNRQQEKDKPNGGFMPRGLIFIFVESSLDTGCQPGSNSLSYVCLHTSFCSYHCCRKYPTVCVWVCVCSRCTRYRWKSVRATKHFFNFNFNSSHMLWTHLNVMAQTNFDLPISLKINK